MYPFEGFGRPIQAGERLPGGGKKSISRASPRGERQKPPVTAVERSPAVGSGNGGSRTSEAATPLGSRWECRLVTPTLGASVDCCQGEGCGMVMCNQPCSFFGDYCCSVHHPEEPEKAVEIAGSQKFAATAGREKKSFFPARKSSDTGISRASPVSEQAKKWRSGQSGGIRIFVGTWNTEYQDIPAEYLASLQERRAPLFTSKRCYTAQQLHAHYTRHSGGIYSGRVSVEEGSDTLSPQQDVTRTSIGSPGASTTATTAASISGMGGDGVKRSASLEGFVYGEESSHPAEVPAEARWRHVTPAAAAIAAAGAAAASAAGGAAAAAARAAAAAGAALSTGRPADTKAAGGDQATSDQSFDYDDEAGEEVEADENKGSAIAKLFVLSSRGPEPLSDWLKPGYDVYVITLQEVISMSTPYTTQRDRHRDARHISTRGHGPRKNFWPRQRSLDTQKGYGYSCYTYEKLLRDIRIGNPQEAVLNASKGAVTLALKIFDQYICFIGCHLPASAKERARCRSIIQQRTAAMYSTDKYVDFTRVFHHIIWAGDFNFRCQCSSETARNEFIWNEWRACECLPVVAAVSLLKENRLRDLLKYDECAQEVSKDMELNCWVEAPIRFLPTYKKRICRPALNLADADWPEQQYETTMKKRVLGTTKYVERPPSWCDRIFRWSAYGLEKNLTATSGEYSAAEPKTQNYFMASDHAPVGCGFQLKPSVPARRGRAVFIDDYIAKLPPDILERQDAFTTLRRYSASLMVTKGNSVVPPLKQ